MTTVQIVAFVCMLVFTAIAFGCDLKTNKLPNMLTVPTFCAGLIFHAVAGDGLGFAMGGFAVGFGVLLVMWLIGGSGGGDVKFMGALGCWLGAWLTFQVLVVGALLSGILTLTATVKRTFRLRRSSPGRLGARAQDARKKKKADSGWSQPLRAGLKGRVPFGVPAAMATWALLILYLAGHYLEWPPV